MKEDEDRGSGDAKKKAKAEDKKETKGKDERGDGKKRKLSKEDAPEGSEKKHKDKTTEKIETAIVATSPDGIIKKPKTKTQDDKGEGEKEDKKLNEAEKSMRVNSTTHRKMWMKFLRFRKNKKKMRMCPAHMVAALQSEARVSGPLGCQLKEFIVYRFPFTL